MNRYSQLVNKITSTLNYALINDEVKSKDGVQCGSNLCLCITNGSVFFNE